MTRLRFREPFADVWRFDASVIDSWPPGRLRFVPDGRQSERARMSGALSANQVEAGGTGLIVIPVIAP